jgi:hypothetical protein
VSTVAQPETVVSTTERQPAPALSTPGP